MTGDRLITIVVPVYNRADIVPRTLSSIQAQSYRPLNVVLVDNGSTDNTLNVLYKWEEEMRDDIQVSVLNCNVRGASNARNMGLNQVDTPWVMFFDSDDTMKPNHVERAIDIIRANPQADIIGWDVLYHCKSGKEKKLRFDYNHLLYDCIQFGSFSTQRYICRTDLLRDCGAWEPNISTWDDIELGVRIITRFPALKIIKAKGKPTVDIFETSNSISGESYHTRAIESEETLRQIERALRPYEQYIVNLKRVILAANYHREGFNHDAKRLKRSALSATISQWHKALLNIAYLQTVCGIPGAARLLYHLF